MSEETPKPSIEVLESAFTELPDEAGKLQPLTHVVFRDELGRIGTVTVPVKNPSDGQIRDAIKKQREAEAARKPHTIEL